MKPPPVLEAAFDVDLSFDADPPPSRKADHKVRQTTRIIACFDPVGTIGIIKCCVDVVHLSTFSVFAGYGDEIDAESKQGLD